MRIIAVNWAICVGLAAWAAAQEAATQPATRGVPSTQERLSAFVALIEGPNAPEVRRTGARELLLARRPESVARVSSVLSGSNAPARIAMAATLAELPEFLEPAYIEPLMGMLTDADPAVREAAAITLAAYPDSGVTERLRQLAVDTAQARPARLAALYALGTMTDRDAIEALAAVLGDADSTVAQAALAALTRATAIDFNDDLDVARAWWAEESKLSPDAWRERQIERLVRKDREMRRRLEAVEARLTKVLEASFTRAADTERISLLMSYLTDPAPTFRLLGLKFAQAHLLEGKSLPNEVQERMRELLSSPDAAEQAAAIRATASLREPRDALRFMDMLPGVRNREVRLALLNALGHLGNASATGMLLAMLEEADEPTATETIAALGRLAERGVLGEVSRERVIGALLREFEATRPAQVALRERILWAMGNVAALRFLPAFSAAVDRQQPIAVRQAAVRGLAALRNPQAADLLAVAASDPDAGIRKTAVDALSIVGSAGSDQHMQALWERVVSPQETDETIRQAAWRGMLELLTKASPAQADHWIARLAAVGAPDSQRTLELLERLARILGESQPVDRARLGSVRARLAAQYAAAERPTDALATYLAALDDLQAAKSDAARSVALELLRLALLSGRYDAAVAAGLANAAEGNGVEPLWELAETLIQQRMNAADVDQALAMLSALQEWPPGSWSDEIRARQASMRERALALTAPGGDGTTAPAPVTQPATAPAHDPTAP